MKATKKYRTIKELPNIKEWSIIELNPVDGLSYINEDGSVSIEKSIVENNPRFFQEVNENNETQEVWLKQLNRILRKHFYMIDSEYQPGYDKCLNQISEVIKDMEKLRK